MFYRVLEKLAKVGILISSRAWVSQTGSTTRSPARRILSLQGWTMANSELIAAQVVRIPTGIANCYIVGTAEMWVLVDAGTHCNSKNILKAVDEHIGSEIPPAISPGRLIERTCHTLARISSAVGDRHAPRDWVSRSSRCSPRSPCW